MRGLVLSCILILLSITFTSCEDTYVSSGRKLYVKYLKKSLKDPDSLKIYSEKYTKDGTVKVLWEVDHGAKNSFGAMVRSTLKCETIGGSTIFVEEGARTNIYQAKDLE